MSELAFDPTSLHSYPHPTFSLFLVQIQPQKPWIQDHYSPQMDQENLLHFFRLRNVADSSAARAHNMCCLSPKRRTVRMTLPDAIRLGDLAL